MRDLIVANSKTTDKVLIIGCGNSRMPEEMYEDGYQHITSIDLSFSAIKLQNEEYKDKFSNLTFMQMDARTLQFKDDYFDLVIDKGLLDALTCGDGAA